MVERLSMLDASFLSSETTATPLHTAGIGIFHEGLAFDRVLATLRQRIGEIAQGRRRVRRSSFVGGRPVWVDDADFDLTYHLRHAALPPPGDTGQLGEFLSRLFARPLDRDRPLWEIYVIEGLEGGRTGVFRKVHLAMAGGDRRDPFSVLLDETPEGRGQQREPVRWEPAAPPPRMELAVEAALDGVDRVVGAGRGAVRLATDPGRLARLTASAVGDAAGMLLRAAGNAPRSPLNVTLSSHRRMAMVTADLDDFRAVRRAFGCSVNDVVVAVASDAVGRLLRWRGYETTDLDLRVMVPIRVHDTDTAGRPGIGEALTVGDGVVGVLAPLPVMRLDPVARLYRVMGELAGLKESRQAVAADALVRLAGFAPPNLHAAAARLVSADHRYNLALSNAPGPQTPRYLAGVLMEENYPFLPLVGDSALSIAVTSYVGQLTAGFVGERDAIPDLHLLRAFWTDSLADLKAAADAAS